MGVGYGNKFLYPINIPPNKIDQILDFFGVKNLVGEDWNDSSLDYSGKFEFKGYSIEYWGSAYAGSLLFQKILRKMSKKYKILRHVCFFAEGNIVELGDLQKYFTKEALEKFEFYGFIKLHSESFICANTIKDPEGIILFKSNSTYTYNHQDKIIETDIPGFSMVVDYDFLKSF